MPWMPGKRRSDRALETPFNDVPPHLAQPLWDWFQDGILSSHDGRERMRQIALHLRMSSSPDPDAQLREFLRRANEEPTFVLDLVEAALFLYRWDRGRATELRSLLDDANSTYMVNDSMDGLELRLANGVKSVVNEAAQTAIGSAGEHLAAAWNATHGRRPDHDKAYHQAVMAVESALAPHISPNNQRQTLGTMVRDIRAKPDNWTFAICNEPSTGVETVAAMMQVLWQGQARHGGTTPTHRVTPAESQAAVHLAAALVQFATGGSFQRSDSIR